MRRTGHACRGTRDTLAAGVSARGDGVRRRDFIAAMGVSAWPLGALAQAMPVVGFLNSASSATYRFNADAFREGLAAAGYVEGRNVLIEERWANADYSALPAL